TVPGPGPGRLVGGLLGGAGDGPASLETESDADRAAVLARLERLGRDAQLGERAVCPLAELWVGAPGAKPSVPLLRGLGGAAGGRFGTPADAEATVVAWRERLAAGAAPLELLS